MALDPKWIEKKQKGKYSTKFDSVMGAPTDQGYHEVPAPQVLRSVGTRKPQMVPVVLPQEQLQEHMEERREEIRGLLVSTDLRKTEGDGTRF